MILLWKYIFIYIGLIVCMLVLSIFFACIDVHNVHHPDPSMYEKCMHRVDKYRYLVSKVSNTVIIQSEDSVLHGVWVGCVTSVCDCAMAPSGRIKLVDPHFSISLIYFNDMNIVSLPP